MPGTVMSYGGFCCPRGQKIYESITSLEVTFKKVTFKVLMNSCSLGASHTPCRVQSTSALERDRLVFGRSCDHRFKWSVGLNEEDHIMGCIDQYHRGILSPSFPTPFVRFSHPAREHPPLPRANFDHLSLIQGSLAKSPPTFAQLATRFDRALMI